MIRLPITRLRDGMVTAQSIYNSEGASYLTRGTKLNQQYIDRLRKIGISSVTITSLICHCLPLRISSRKIPG